MSMDTILKRNYDKTGNIAGRGTEKKPYPIWDGRPHLGNDTTPDGSTSSGISSCPSNEAVWRKTGMSLERIPGDGLMAVHSHVDDVEDGTCHSALSMITSKDFSLSDQEELPVIALSFIESNETASYILDLYNPIIQWIDPSLRLFTGCHHSDILVEESAPKIAGTLDMPSLAIIVFLQEEEMIGDDRLSLAKQYFSSTPWKFHHSEWVSAYHIQEYEYNSHDYFLPAEDLPLCSVRQIHCGGEHVRMVRFVTAHNWQDTINLYKILLGQDPAFVKLDFCVFTVESHPSFDVQFALKKLPRGVVPRESRRAVLTIRVNDVTRLVPLLPYTCTHLGGRQWSTRDLDGNQLLIDVIGPCQDSKARVGNVRATAEVPPRLSARVELSPPDGGDARLRQRTERRHRTKRVKPPIVQDNFAQSRAGAGFRPIFNPAHQRTDSGFIEESRGDILTDIAIDAIHKLGKRANQLARRMEESPPDSPWESKSNTSTSDVFMPAVDSSPSVLNTSTPTVQRDMSLQHESGFGDNSDIESVRESSIDCDRHSSVAERMLSCASTSRDTVTCPHHLSAYSTVENLKADFTSPANSTDTGSHIHTPDVSTYPHCCVSQPDIHPDYTIADREELDSFFESLKQREISRNYATRIGAHGTLSSDLYSIHVHNEPGISVDVSPRTDTNVKGQEGVIGHRQRVLDRTKLPPPPLPPKPKLSHMLPMYAAVEPKTGRLDNVTQPERTRSQKKVTFKDDTTHTDHRKVVEHDNHSKPLGFWI